MKQALSLFLSLIILCSSTIICFNAQTNKKNDGKEAVSDDSYIATDDEAQEEKILCEASLDDEFDDSSIIVAFKHKESLEIRDYKNDTIKDCNVEYAYDLTPYETETIFDDYTKAISICSISDSKKIENLVTRKKHVSIKEIKPLISPATQLFAKNSIEQKHSKFHRIVLFKVKEKGKNNVLRSIKMLEKRDDVLLADPNYKSHPCVIPNDSHYTNQWAPANMNLPSVWNIQQGSKNVCVGIIDSGINGNHTDLKGNINTNLSKSYVDNSPLIDSDGHGTNIAGVIGAIGNNGKGVAGVCWKISLVSLKTYIDDNDFNYNNDIKAIDYAKNNNIPILNYSAVLEGNVLSTAIKNYNGLFVCSAGNEGKNIQDCSYKYPSSNKCDNLISVASINSSNKRSTFSNYSNTCVQLAAPGENIYTTNKNGTYSSVDGTSFSAPQVAGVAALIKSQYPTITYQGIKTAIMSNCTTLSALNNKVETNGKLNASAALNGVANRKYTIKYNKNGGTGSTMSNTTVTYGIPTALKSNTYSFSGVKHFAGWTAHRQSDNKWLYKTGWHLEGTQPSGDTKYVYNNEAIVAHSSVVNNDVITMYAQWETNTYTINYIPECNAYETMDDQTVVYGISQNLHNCVYNNLGYSFVGWNAHRLSDNKWFYENGVSAQWCLENQQPSGYYKHIYRNQASVSQSSSVNQDIVEMHAVWQPNTYTVTYDLDGATGTIADTYGQTGTPSELSSTIPTRYGFTFLGWRIVDEYGFWSTTYTDPEWQRSIPFGYMKRLHQAGGELNYVAEDNASILTAKALWKRNWHVVGDIDRSGAVSSGDVNLLRAYLNQQAELDDEQLYLADMNQDGMINSTDDTILFSLM